MGNTKTGLVLEGGGMRGMYTAGVLDVFLENNIWPDGVIGVSAGAAYGCSYMSNQLGRSIRYNLAYVGDKNYISFDSLIKTGDICNSKFCYETIPNELDPFDYDEFKKRAKDIPFYVGCSDLETGRAYYKKCVDLREELDYVRASASLPLVSKTVCLGGRKLLDGGSTDSVPMAFMRHKGFRKNIVVLTRPEGYVKKPDSMIKLIEMKYRAYPRYVKASINRYNTYNRSMGYIDYFKRKGEALVIRPSESIKIGRLEKNKDKLIMMYRLGVRDAEAMLPEIKKFLEN